MTSNSNRYALLQMTAPLARGTCEASTCPRTRPSREEARCQRSRLGSRPGRQGTVVAAFLTSFLLFSCPPAHAQNSPDLQEILSRLDRLERDNLSLTDEVR